MLEDLIWRDFLKFLIVVKKKLFNSNQDLNEKLLVIFEKLLSVLFLQHLFIVLFEDEIEILELLELRKVFIEFLSYLKDFSLQFSVFFVVETKLI